MHAFIPLFWIYIYICCIKKRSFVPLLLLRSLARSLICDLKSDETRSVTHVNKAYLVWFMFRVLSNQHHQRRPNQKLRSWANAVFQNNGVWRQAFPSPVIPFFCSRPNFLDQLARKRFLRRLRLRANGRNNSQHCCANYVGSCCVRVGSGVQTDETTPNNVRTCSASWEGYNP